MEPEKKTSEKNLLTRKSEKFGLLKRFLDWIASGADKSHLSGTSCPT